MSSARPVGTLCVIPFRAVGRIGSQTPLQLAITTVSISEEEGTRPAHEEIDGVVYLGQGIAGTRPGTMQNGPSASECSTRRG